MRNEFKSFEMSIKRQTTLWTWSKRSGGRKSNRKYSLDVDTNVENIADRLFEVDARTVLRRSKNNGKDVKEKGKNGFPA